MKPAAVYACVYPDDPKNYLAEQVIACVNHFQKLGKQRVRIYAEVIPGYTCNIKDILAYALSWVFGSELDISLASSVVKILNDDELTKRLYFELERNAIEPKHIMLQEESYTEKIAEIIKNYIQLQE